MDFCVLSGDDFTALPLMMLGAKGVISVTSNIVPAKTAGMCNAFFAGDMTRARSLHYELEPLNRMMFIESNPIPVKSACAILGKMSDEIRLPLCHLSDEHEKQLREVLMNAGILK